MIPESMESDHSFSFRGVLILIFPFLTGFCLIKELKNVEYNKFKQIQNLKLHNIKIPGVELKSENRSQTLRFHSLETLPTSQSPGLTPLVNLASSVSDNSNNSFTNNSLTNNSLSSQFYKTQSYSTQTTFASQNPVLPPLTSELDSFGNVSEFVCPNNPDSKYYKADENIEPFFNQDRPRGRYPRGGQHQVERVRCYHLSSCKMLF